MSNTELSNTEIKERVFRLLEIADEICKKEKIKYSLCFGTLLGAVRHGGFIPWDDDVDICMKREDYRRFLEACDRKYNNNDSYKLLHIDNNDSYYYNFAKLIDYGTTVAENGYLPIKDFGLYVDVFPLDGCPGEKKEFERYMLKIKAYSALKSVSAATDFGKDVFTKKGIIKLFLYIPAKVFGVRFWAKRLEKLLDKYNNCGSEFMCCLTEYPKFAEVMNADALDETTKIIFEGSQFEAFKDYKKYLTDRYGDFMRLPPEHERTATHNYKAYLK